MGMRRVFELHGFRFRHFLIAAGEGPGSGSSPEGFRFAVSSLLHGVLGEVPGIFQLSSEKFGQQVLPVGHKKEEEARQDQDHRDDRRPNGPDVIPDQSSIDIFRFRCCELGSDHSSRKRERRCFRPSDSECIGAPAEFLRPHGHENGDAETDGDQRTRVA